MTQERKIILGQAWWGRRHKNTWRLNLKRPGWEGQVVLNQSKSFLFLQKTPTLRGKERPTTECEWAHSAMEHEFAYCFPRSHFLIQRLKLKCPVGEQKGMLLTNVLASYDVELILAELNQPLCFPSTVYQVMGSIAATIIIIKGIRILSL